MLNITTSNLAAPTKQWFQVVSGCALASCFGLIVTSPSQQMRHVNMNCQTSRPPAALITEVGAPVSAECLLVRSVTRESSLWVY